jgi:hypothetical protein
VLHRERFKDRAAFLQVLSEAHWGTGALGPAGDCYDELARSFPSARGPVLDAAQFHLLNGRRVRAEELAQQALARAARPVSPQDYYLDGLANWILKRPECANYDFERSGRPQHDHYSRWLTIEADHPTSRHEGSLPTFG